MPNKKLLEDIIQRHYHYLKEVNFQGWDVLDGLNSKLFQRLPFHDNKYFRLLWIQFFRRSPINFRRISLVPKEYNPKALALFVSGLVNLYRHYGEKSYLEQALNLYDKVVHFKSKNYTGLCWGYNFDWQARAFNVPAYKPNMVCSVFGGHALLDLFKTTGENRYLKQAEDVAAFILNHLILSEASDRICFGYIPDEPAVIHNVNLLGAAYLARLYAITEKNEYRLLAEKSVRFSVLQQREDGAWVYGNQGHHRWVDNFHTGYNLVSIYRYQHYCKDVQFEQSILTGLDFHLKNHYTGDLLPKYSDRSRYPFDIHCFAQAVITFMILKKYIPEVETKINQVLNNVIDMLWDTKRNYFWYKKSRFFTGRIPYIRWAQAWMFYSLSHLLAGLDE